MLQDETQSDTRRIYKQILKVILHNSVEVVKIYINGFRNNM